MPKLVLRSLNKINETQEGEIEMEDTIRMDSHKLMYHLCRVSDWLQGKDIYPIEVEISPSGACNHRCVFCAVDYIGYQPDFLQKDIILREIKQMAEERR